MGVISLLMLLIVVLLIVLSVAGIRTKPAEKGEELVKSIYVYLVLFATLMMSIGGSIGVFMALADIISPAPYHQSFEEYRQWRQPEHVGEKDTVVKSDEELRTNYDAMIERDMDQSKQRSLNAFIKSFGWIIIPLPVFFYFQRRLVKKE